MSKAYGCDRCGELYPGTPEVIDENGNDLCPNCVRVMQLLSTIDPLCFAPLDKKGGRSQATSLASNR